MAKSNGARRGRITKTEQADARFAKALAHPLRARILEALADAGELSPNMAAEQLGEKLTNISYHFRMLLDLGAIELLRTEPRRGALEHYYRARVRLTVMHESVPRVRELTG